MKKRILATLMMLIIIATSTVGCTQDVGENSEGNPSGTDEQMSSGNEETENLEWLEYSVWIRSEAEKFANNPNDVVTPYVEDKFKIRVSEVYYPDGTSTLKERLNMMIAADNVPDVIISGASDLEHAIATGLFADVGDKFQEMENINKYFDSKYLERLKTGGVQYKIPSVEMNLSAPEYQDDPYYTGVPQWALWVREDVLSQAGYTFTPMAELEAMGKKPTIEEMAIEPAIDTPEQLYDLLTKINDLGIQVNGNDLIPLTIIGFQQFHLGSMFDFGHWRIDENGEVDGFLGTPGAKDYYKFLAKLYREDLIDKDFVIQKPEQLQDKVASGRVAMGTYVPDMRAAEQAMLEINPEYSVRYIPWPKMDETKGYFDIFEGGFTSAIIREDFEDIDRLLEYFDWFYSDEGLDVLTWGPQSAGLWEMDGDKKVFVEGVDASLFLEGVKGEQGADYYGLYDPYGEQVVPFMSRVGVTVPRLLVGNPFDYRRSYEPDINIGDYMKSIYGSASVNFEGTASYGSGSEAVNTVTDYYWGKFINEEIAKLLITASDEEFDRVWEEQYQAFLEETDYEVAKQEMTQWFAENELK